MIISNKTKEDRVRVREIKLKQDKQAQYPSVSKQ